MQNPLTAAVNGYKTVRKSQSHRGMLRGATSIFALMALLLIFTQVALAANPAPVQVYYIPVKENDALASMQAINNGSGMAADPVTTYVSIAIGTTGTLVYLDQWENGYDPDIANPANLYSAGNLGGTQIWGNGICADGVAPDKNGAIPTCNVGNQATVDALGAGQVILLRNNVTSTNLSAIDFDGGDKVGATDQIAMTRVYWAANSDTLLAAAVELYPTNEWGTLYIAPVGTNDTQYAGGSDTMFEYTAFAVQAATNGTQVTIDANGPAAGGTTTFNLNQGESRVVSGILRGGTVTSTNGSVQVLLLTGDVVNGGRSYQYSGYTLFSRDKWSSSYWSPASTGATSAPTQITAYNPVDQGSAIFVRCEFRSGLSIASSTQSIPAGESRPWEVPDTSGAHCFAVTSLTNNTPVAKPFFAISTTDSALYGSTYGGRGWDWGITLVPDEALSPLALVGLGLGQDPNKSLIENGSPIWVTPVCASTYLYVDFNGDGIADKADLNGNGNTTDTVDGINENTSNSGMLLTTLKSVRVYNPGATSNQTGAQLRTKTASGVLWTAGTLGCDIVVAWGEDPTRASVADPGFDVGTTVPPISGFTVNKTAAMATDADGDGVITPGDTITYTIDIKNTGLASIASVYVTDTVPANTTYVGSSTQTNKTGPWTIVPDVGGTTALAQAGGYNFVWSNLTTPTSLLPGQSFSIRFRVIVKGTASCSESVVNNVIVRSGNKTKTANATTSLDCPAKLTIVKQVNGPSATFAFTTTATPNLPAIAAGMATFNLTPATANGSAQTVFDKILARTYTVRESSLPTSWTFDSVLCVNNGSAPASTFTYTGGTRQANVALAEDGDVTCTYINNRPQLRISLSPNLAENAVGVAHTFTAKLEGSLNGTVWTGVNGATVNWSESGPGSPDSGTCTTSGTGANAGQCTFNVTSTAAGASTVNAAVTNVSYGGQSLSATTVGGAGAYGPATKTWTDLRISISPLTDDNKVGDAHTFTVFVEKKVGAADWAPVQGANPVISYIGTAPSTAPTACSAATGSDGKCSFQINSTAPGVFTVHAKVSFPVVTGQNLVRETNTNPNVTPLGGSADGVKKYVSAKISISPLTPVNAVNVGHTFTVNVQKNDGSGWTNATGVTVTPATSGVGTVTGGTCTTGTTDTNGNCTVFVVSSVPGQTTVGASATVPVLNQNVSVSTNGQGGSSVAGVKTWQDLRIFINPATATNKVGDLHVLTVKVQQNLGQGGANGGWTDLAGVTPSVSVTPAGTTPASPISCPSVTNTSGECMVTINSTAPGLYTASATYATTINGEAIERTTGTTLNTAAGGSGNATKQYVNVRIRLTGTPATNAVNNAHTFPVFVEGTLNGTTWTGINGVNITGSLVAGSVGSLTTGACTTAGAGTCNLVVNSAAAGVSTVNATAASVGYQGMTFTNLTTSGTGENSGPGVKTWVDAKVSISGTATNAVGNQHTFTISAQQNLGAGWVNVPNGTKPVVTITPTGYTPISDGCATAGTVAGSCTVVINSTSAGVFNASAVLNTSVSGQSVTRSTPADAVKTYADLRIKIGDSAVNPLNAPHTFKVTVEKKVGTADWAPVQGAFPTVNITPSGFTAGTNTCPAGTLADGTCTVTINSSIVNVYTAQATVTYAVVTGQDLTRVTGTQLNVDLGGSENAVKTYQEGSLQITKTVVPTFIRSFTWTIQKDVTPASIDLFDGQSQPVNYTVAVVKSAPVDTAHAISGTVTIKNTSNTSPVIINQPVDKTANGVAITLNCGTGTWPRVIAGNGQIVCTYPATTVPGVSSANEVTVTTTSGTESKISEAYGFTLPTITNGDRITVTDSNTTTVFGPYTASATKNYSQDLSCTTQTMSSYVNSKATGNKLNTAQIKFGAVNGPSDNATVAVSCYRLNVNKTANPTLTRTWNWNIAKDVNTSVVNLYEDGSATLSYTVTVSSSGFSDSNRAATGSITVNNPAPKAASVSSLTDVVPGATAVITGTGCTASPYTVPANGSLTCTYDATGFTTGATVINKATAVAYGKEYTGTADINFGQAVITPINPTVNVTDTNKTSPLGSVAVGEAPKEFKYTLPATCADINYNADGTGSKTLPNTAQIVQTKQNDSENVTVNCTKYATITVKKLTVPSDSTQKFTFTGDLAGSIGNNETVSKRVVPGTYTTTETVPAGWKLTSVVCSDSDSSAAGEVTTFKAAAGESVTCTYTNTKGLARIYFDTPEATNAVNVKHAFTATVETSVDNGATWQAVGNQLVTGSLVAPAFGTLEAPGTCTTNAAGKCALTVSSAAAGVTILNASANVDVLGLSTLVTTSGSAGQFRNAVKTWVDAAIAIDGTASNAVGNDHTFKVMAVQKIGNGALGPVADGEKPVVTITPAGYTLVSDGCATSGTVNGQCTVVITSASAAVFHASAVLNTSVAGQSVTRSTPADAVKTYVDLHIKIGPAEATNPLNQSHIFTVTVEQNIGGAGWTPVLGATPVITITPAGFTPAGAQCAAPTNALGECYVTINSNVVKTYTAQAGITFAVAPGQELTRETGTEPNLSLGGSGNAIKHYTEGSLEVTKTAIPTFKRSFTWTIEKVVDPTSLDLFDGESVPVDYTVTVTKSAPVDTEHAVSGTVTIRNTSSSSPVIIYQPVDVLADVTPVVLECGTTTWPYTIPASGELDCTYPALSVPAVAGSNKVTVTTTSGTVVTQTVDYAFVTPTTLVNDQITVTDTNTTTVFGPYSANAEKLYSQDLSCTTQGMSEYVEGKATGSKLNTAQIKYGAVSGPSDNATVDVSCYRLVVTKTAVPTYDNRYTWEISKTVVPTEVNMLQGETADLDYTVVVTRSGPTPENFAVSGSITISNPHPSRAATGVVVTDQLSNADLGTGDNIFTPACPSADVPANGSLSCTYAGPVVGVDQFSLETNTATATFLEKQYYGLADVYFVNAEVSEIDPSVTVTDTNQALPLGTEVVDSDTFTYTLPATCDNAVYNEANNRWEKVLPNTAQIVETGDKDDASVQVNCLKDGEIIIEKLTVPSGDAQLFDFSTDFSASIQLSDGMTKSVPVMAGTYHITETLPATGWDLTDVSCVLVSTNTDPIEPAVALAAFAAAEIQNPKEVIVGGGETWKCTFTNTKWGNLVVKKVAPDDTTKLFTFQGAVEGQIPDGGELTRSLPQGGYSVTEIVPNGWTLRGISPNCSGEQVNAAGASESSGVYPTAFAYVEPGLTTTCVFTNSLPSIVTTKTATPERLPSPGGDVVFNVSVENTSKLDPVTITDLTDSVYGDITQVQGRIKTTTCALGALLQPGEVYNCNFTSNVSVPNETAIDFVETDVVTATGYTDFEVQVQAHDDATVTVFIVGTATLGDYVWLDRNPNGQTTSERLAGDGLQNDPLEHGVTAITVQLFAAGPDGQPNTPDDTLVATATTGPDGKYNFAGLKPGKYYLAFTKPDGPRAWGSLLNVGNDPAIDSDVKIDANDPNKAYTRVIDVLYGTNDPTWDAAIVDTSGAASADLGDFVWNDLNKNGVQDPGEPGVPNVKVDLYLVSGQPAAAEAQGAAAPLATTTTNASGLYNFLALDQGTYYLKFNVPTGYSVSPRNQGGNAAKDSDIDEAGKTGNINLLENTSDMTWDAGIYVTPTSDNPSDEPTATSTSIFLPTVQR